MSSSRTPRSSPVSPSESDTPRSFVRFPENGSPVTGEMRYPNRFEQSSFDHYEVHAKQCSACYKCYDNHRSGRGLCSEGLILARDILCHVYPQNDLIIAKSVSSQVLTRVELDTSVYRQVRQLMKLVERKGARALEGSSPSPRGRDRSSTRRPRVPAEVRPDSGVYFVTPQVYDGYSTTYTTAPPTYATAPPAPFTYTYPPTYATPPAYPVGPAFPTPPTYPTAPAYPVAPTYPTGPTYPYQVFDTRNVRTYTPTPSSSRSDSTGATVGRRNSGRRR